MMLGLEMTGKFKKKNCKQISILSIMMFFVLLLQVMLPSAFVSEAATPPHERLEAGMTLSEYRADDILTSLNTAANEQWNIDHGFYPTDATTRVVTNFDDFKSAYTNDSITKIILNADIVPSGNGYSEAQMTMSRHNSIEIDGSGLDGTAHYKLYLYDGNTDGGQLEMDINSAAEYNSKTSTHPVFHMHDVDVANQRTAKEAGLGAGVAFFQGEDLAYDNQDANGTGYYRIGNVTTPYTAGKKEHSARIVGRLLSVDMAEVSVWGWNDIVTNAENFYLGAFHTEAYTHYSGVNADADYSVIWATQPALGRTSSANGQPYTGDNKMILGQGSFIYVQNSTTGGSYPAFYECFKDYIVEEDVTLNLSMQGNAFRFNMNDGTFTAKKGSKVAMLSRGTGSATFAFSGGAAAGGVGTSNNCTVNFEEGSTVYLYANSNSDGTINMDNGNNNTFTIDKPNIYDIRNTPNNTSTRRSVLKDNDDSIGTSNTFKITNSDIALWKYNIAIDGAAGVDDANISNFSFTNSSLTSSSSLVKSYWDSAGKSDISRISGVNTSPEVEWLPVTNADKTFKSKLKLGVYPEGGSSPFDENGQMKTKVVYADNATTGYLDMTLPNGTSSNQIVSDGSTNGKEGRNFENATKAFAWTPDAPNNVFQVAGTLLSATGYRAPARQATGDTTVIDIIPPNPAVITTQTVTTATTQLTGTGEADAIVTLTVNGVIQSQTATVASDGKFTLELPSSLAKDDVLQIFLSDQSGAAAELADRPATNTDIGNNNPASDLTYRDTTFLAATKVTVKELVLTPITFTKVDRDVTSKELSGAKFKLYDTDGNQLGTEQESDASGTVDFGKYGDGAYLLEEVQAPNDYLTPVGKWTVLIDHTKTPAVEMIRPTTDTSVNFAYADPFNVANQRAISAEGVTASSWTADNTNFTKDTALGGEMTFNQTTNTLSIKVYPSGGTGDYRSFRVGISDETAFLAKLKSDSVRVKSWSWSQSNLSGTLVDQSTVTKDSKLEQSTMASGATVPNHTFQARVANTTDGGAETSYMILTLVLEPDYAKASDAATVAAQPNPIEKNNALAIPNIQNVHFNFTKQDAATGKPLAGVSFKLEGVNGTTYAEVSKTSLADGLVDFEILPDGQYRLIETSTLNGYEKPNGSWLLTVDHTKAFDKRIKITLEDGADGVTPPAFDEVVDTTNKVVRYSLVNERAVGLVYTVVKAEDPDQILPNVSFKLYKKESATSAEVVTDANVASGDFKLIQTKSSDSAGKIDWGYLADGTYYLVQTSAPTAYQRPIGQWKIDIDNSQAADDRMTITGKGKLLPPAFIKLTGGTSVSYKLPVMKQTILPYAGRLGIIASLFLGITLVELGGALYYQKNLI
ncbi:hypothetical protein RyT2_13660 [Pseudolactococcus yaeyamensis]